ncbi:MULTISPECIES: hypothetical protein [Cytobacillus]|uniref:hypothetical protein n=1 Tax=Cytobacillus TaxID=2675230 RepID=UPI00203FA853|nr:MULTISPECIES: hypothetical protein [Cytobacillus]UQX56059.1 hypothetical protein M5V91_10760 [Cytobacillus pseudoceanisediminis]
MKTPVAILLSCFLLIGCTVDGGLTHSDCMEENGTFLYEGWCTEMSDIPEEDQEEVLMEYVDEQVERTGMTRENVLETMIMFLDQQ